MSWTPREFEWLLIGAKHREIDQYEYMANQAMAYRYAVNAKKARKISIFNADKARRMIERGFKGDVSKIEKERIKRMTEAVKGFKPQFTRGGR